jgi:hypothetical protein
VAAKLLLNVSKVLVVSPAPEGGGLPSPGSGWRRVGTTRNAMSDLLKRTRRILRGKLAALAPQPPGERAKALAVLELAPDATASEVRSAYRRLCRKYHPDRFANDDAKANTAHELFVEIHRAYKLLTESGPEN